MLMGAYKILLAQDPKETSFGYNEADNQSTMCDFGTPVLSCTQLCEDTNVCIANSDIKILNHGLKYTSFHFI